MVNYLADSSLKDDNGFGGAFFASAEGELIASWPLGEAGILIVEMESAAGNV
jgi:hypothetical protein